MLLQKLARVGIVHVGIGHHGVLVRTNQARGGIKCKQIIYRRGHFKRAFVPVAFDPLYPLGVDHAGAHHPRQFFAQRANAHGAGGAEVTMVKRRLLAAQMLYRCGHASVELVVIV